MLFSTLKWLLPNTTINGNRNIATSSVCFNDGTRLSGETHRVNNFEKRLLVWMGKYKSIEEIPAYVTPESVEKARSRMRIRVSNVMMALTLVGCVAMAYTGKKARDRGESLHQYNLDMHEKYNKEHSDKKA